MDSRKNQTVQWSQRGRKIFKKRITVIDIFEHRGMLLGKYKSGANYFYLVHLYDNVWTFSN